MVANGPAIELNDFSGGLNTFDPEYISPLNQSPDLDNLIILDKGFKKRNGDSAWNSSAMVSSSTAVTGIGYIKFNSGTEFLNAVAGTKFFTDSSLSGTMTDTTGAITITTGQNNLWTPVIYNNIQIWFGGAPDAPFKYSGSGNAAALGGTPPSATTAFVANNRIFAISTAANPSRIQWSVLSDPEDWTGTGSGSSDVNKSDGEALQCGIVIGPDTAILFKNSSTHMMILTRQPFPIYQLQKGIGIAGKNAYVYANGVIYFVTPGLRMKSTVDGSNFQTYPNDINDIWDSINSVRIPYIQGFYYQPLEWVMWVVSTGSNTTNNYLIVWDIQRKCFLRCTSGFKLNTFGLIQNKRMFGGHYNGKMYEKIKSGIFSDASETSPGAINSYWRTPYSNLTTEIDQTIHPVYVDVVALTEVSSTLVINYGFDFTSPSSGSTFSLVAAGSLWDVALWDVGVWGGQNATVLTQFVLGRGNLFSYTMSNNTASQGFTVQGTTVRVKKDGARKVFTGV
jgi:hypothetical protein